MVELLIAIVGVVGTFAAGSAFSEWLKRRSLHGSIKADLDVWAALPDSDAKTNLLSRIEGRVNGLAVESPPRWRLIAFWFPSGLLWAAFFVGITVINGGYGFRRDADGILRWYTADGSTITFQRFALGLLAAYVISMFVTQLFVPLGSKLVRRIFNTTWPTSQTAAQKG